MSYLSNLKNYCSFLTWLATSWLFLFVQRYSAASRYSSFIALTSSGAVGRRSFFLRNTEAITSFSLRNLCSAISQSFSLMLLSVIPESSDRGVLSLNRSKSSSFYSSILLDGGIFASCWFSPKSSEWFLVYYSPGSSFLGYLMLKVLYALGRLSLTIMESQIGETSWSGWHLKYLASKLSSGLYLYRSLALGGNWLLASFNRDIDAYLYDNDAWR